MFSRDEFFSLTDFEHASLWREEGSLWDPITSMESYIRHFPHKIEVDIPDHVTLKNRHLISIGEGTVLEPSVYIEGPCIIGKNCKIRHAAYIRNHVILGDFASVGHCCELKNSLLMHHAVAAHFCYVGDSILGPHVNLGAGVKCSNLRLDRQLISVKYQNQRVPTGLTKLGAILGAGVQIGCNTVLNPGTFIAKESIVYPLLTLSGYIPSGVLIRSNGEQRSYV